MLIGIVGKPNCGKSTFFKAATLAEVEIGNRPFVTLEPNHGIAYVKVDCPEKFFKVKCNPREGYCIDGIRFVPIELLDVAGLVPGAHEGKGMGNQFLDDLREADALIHVIDVSGGTNEKGEPIEPGSYDPAKDIKFLEVELDYWYLRLIKKGWGKYSRIVSKEKEDLRKALTVQLSGLKVNEEMVEKALKEMPADYTAWSDKDLFKLSVILRRLSKPMIIACNKIDLPHAKENYERLKKEFPNIILMPCSGDFELALKEAAKKEIIKYVPGERKFEIKKSINEGQKNALEHIKKNVLDAFEEGTGVQKILNITVFDFLKYVAIFPGGINNLADKKGNILPDCFLLPPGSTALDFAFRIHTDIGNNFVKAIDVKRKLPIKKDHLLKSGDVVEIMTK